MNFRLIFTDEAKANLAGLKKDLSKKALYKAVCKTLGYMETNLKHPGLKTHKFVSIKGPQGEALFEAYAQNQTPGAWRVFWHYGPDKNQISVVAIVPHP